MIKYAVKKISGNEYLQETNMERSRFKFVNNVENASMFDKLIIAKDVLKAAKYQNPTSSLKIVEIHIVYEEWDLP